MLSTQARRRLSDDRGVTLVELLVVIVILGIIIVPLGTAMITYFKTSNQTTNLLSESHDGQIAAAYFAQDVQSVGVHDWTATAFPTKQSIELNVGPTSGLYPCGSATTKTALLRLAWDDPVNTTTDSNVVVVSYVLDTRQLHRIECHNTTVVSDTVIAHNVNSYDGPTCSSSCTSATLPATVTLTLHLHVAGTNDPDYVVTLIGQRRQT